MGGMTKPLKDQKLAVGIATLVVLVCCGATVGPFALGGDGKKPAAAPTAISTTAQTRQLVDTGTPTPDPGVSPSPADTAAATPASTGPAIKPSPKPTKTTSTPRPKTTTAKPKPKPTTAKPKPPSVQQGVHPGAFCTPEGAMGKTSKGTLMRCTRKAGEKQPRWRAA